ncbi:MAG: Gfo/Idh/MocA family oxidoreductase [Desulfohalobiaceae bacterium]|nr:Gfo/Idh/MocA family oxidoreductase [Desulfohalobiaceae bacterium]
MANNIAVVGSGYWGQNLIRNYHSLGCLRLICDTNETVLHRFQEQYPDVPTCMAYSQVCSIGDIKGVVIATPAETHYNLAREALLAGKHIYVEKPLVLEVDQGEELIRLAEEQGLVLMVGHLLQFHPAFEYLNSLVASGELGRINYIYSHRLNLGKIRREENILWSFAPHDISMILRLSGEMPEKVQATGGNYLHQRIADVTTTHLSFPSGLKAHIFVSWLHPFKEQKLVVVGDKKMAVFDDTLPWPEKLRLYPHQIHWESNIPVPAKAEAEVVDVKEAEPLKLECLHFLDCIANARQPMTDGAEGLRVLKVLKASQRSLDAEGQRAESRVQRPAGSDQRSKVNSLNLINSDRQPTTNPYIHETTVIDDDCSIGNGTRIWHFSHVLSGSSIGENCNIGQNVVIGPDVSIGPRCKIQNNVSIYKGVALEQGVFCGPSMVFTNILNPRAEISKLDQIKPTLVKQGATLGANCTIVCGVTIGKYALIGAGALVTKDIPDQALVVGNPARQIGWVCECGERMDDNHRCPVCGITIKSLRDSGIEEFRD